MKQTATLALLAGTNILVTVAFQWLVLTQLGVGSETDALFAAMAVPQLILLVVSSSLTYVLVPLLTVEKESSFHQNAWGFFLGTSALFTALAFLLALTTGFWVPWLVPGFSREAQRLTVTLTRIQLTSMIFTASLSVLWSVYRARQKFVWIELSTLLSSLIALLLLIKILPVYGVVGASILIVVRIALQNAWLLPGLGPWRRPDWRSSTMRQAWARVRPLLLGNSYFRADQLLDRFLASMAPAGGLTLLYLGQQIYGVANVVAEKAIASPMVPQLALLAGATRWPEFRNAYRKRLLLMAVVTALGYVGLLIVGERVLAVLIGHGGVTRDNVHLLWLIMVALIGYLVAGALGTVIAQAFFAMGDTRTPMRVTIITFTLYIPLKVFGFIRYGLVGMALVTSAYMFANVAILIFILEKFALPRRERERQPVAKV